MSDTTSEDQDEIEKDLPRGPPTSNMEFRPLPSTSGKCSKIKFDLVFDSPVFIGGDSIQGRLEIQCLTDLNLYLGEIAVTLTAFEGSSI